MPSRRTPYRLRVAQQFLQQDGDAVDLLARGAGGAPDAHGRGASARTAGRSVRERSCERSRSKGAVSRKNSVSPVVIASTMRRSRPCSGRTSPAAGIAGSWCSRSPPPGGPAGFPSDSLWTRSSVMAQTEWMYSASGACSSGRSLITRPPSRTERTIVAAIISSGTTVSTRPAAMASLGMPKTTQLASSCAMAKQPPRFSMRKPAVPSFPIPVRMAAMARPGKVQRGRAEQIIGRGLAVVLRRDRR